MKLLQNSECAWQTTKPDLNVALKGSGKGAAGGSERSRLRNLLLVAEFAVSIDFTILFLPPIFMLTHLLRKAKD